MKIAFIVNGFPYLSETFILNQITGLIDLGHEVEIFAETAPSEPTVHADVEKYNLMTAVRYLPVMPKNKLLRKLKILLFVLLQFIKNPLGTLKKLVVVISCRSFISHSLLYLLFYVPKNKFDIIHCHFGHYGFVGIALKRAGAKSRIVTEFHGQDVSVVSGYKKQVRDKLFEECDLFLTVCDYFKNKLVDLGCETHKITCHHTGINLDKFTFRHRSFPEDGIVKVLTISRLVEKKGIDYSIKAIAKLLDRHKNIQYTIVGSGPLEQQWQNLVSELRVEESVKFLPAKKQDEIAMIYDKSHIFILACLTASDGQQEGIPNVLKEAMACGLPVVSTYHSGICELVTDNVSGMLTQEKDINALSEKLEYLIEHPEIWAKIGQNARAVVEESFNSERLSKRLESIYNGLLIGVKK